MARFPHALGNACLILALVATFAASQKPQGRGRGEKTPDWVQRGGGGGRPGKGAPPPEAEAACESMAREAACSWTNLRGHTVAGACKGKPGGTLHCKPDRKKKKPGVGKGNGVKKVEQKKREMKHAMQNSSVVACEGLQEEEACTFRPPVLGGPGRGRHTGGRPERPGICVPISGKVVKFCRGIPPQAAMDACESSLENEACSYSRNGIDTRVRLQVWTCQKEMAETRGTVLASFYIPSLGEWTEEEVFFDDEASVGQEKSRAFTLPGEPDKVTLTIWSNDAWCFWKVAINGKVVFKNADGPSGGDIYYVENATSAYSTSKHWIEGPPSSQIFDTPSSMSPMSLIAPQTVDLHIYTATSENAATKGSVFVSFLVGTAWTPQQLMFTGATAGEEMTSSFSLQSWPAKVWISTDSADPYGYWKVTVNQLPVVEDPSGSEGLQDFDFDAMEKYFQDGVQFWIAAPPSSQTIEFMLPAQNGPKGLSMHTGTCQATWWDMLNGTLHCRPETRGKAGPGVKEKTSSRPNGVEPNWNIKSDLEEASTPESVEITFVVANIAYPTLISSPRLVEGFISSIQRTVAAAAGEGVYAKHVEVELSAGSVVVDATIAPPAYVSRTNIRKLIGTTNDVAAMVAQDLEDIPDIQSVKVKERPISVIGFSVKASSNEVASTETNEDAGINITTVVIIALGASSFIAFFMCIVSVLLFKKLRASKTSNLEIDGTTVAIGRPVAPGQEGVVEGVTVNVVSNKLNNSEGEAKGKETL